MEIWATDRLPLESARNIREMGGYPAAGGRMTRSGLFLRGDGISNLTEQDCEQLYDYGVRMVLDLRCRSEWLGQDLPLLGYRDVIYGSMPMLDDVIVEPSAEDFPESLGVQYIRMLEKYKKKMRTIFLCLSGQIEDCVLFHCTAGKDRTGVVAMLLLMLAGTPEEFIVADYVKTDLYVRSMMDARMAELAAMGVHYPEHVFRTDPDNIRLAMRHVQEKYGGCEGYLRACDVREEAIARLMARFVGGKGLLRMPERLPLEALAPCGVLCSACEMHLREKDRCSGCTSEGKKRGYCGRCARRSCAMEKGVRWCWQCEDFPCTRARSMDRSYRQRYGVSLTAWGREAVEKGEEALLETLRRRYTCGCGGIISLQGGICKECGQVREAWGR